MLPRLLVSFLAANAVTVSAFAQNISGVPGADVAAGEKEIGYRAALRVDETGDSFVHRLHYQQSLDDSWRLRVVVLQSIRDGDARFRSAQIEAMFQFVESEASGGWDSAVRVDGTIPLEDSAGRVRVSWLNNIDLGSAWQVRADVFAGREIGDLAPNGLVLEARGEATYRLSSALRAGAQTFNTFRPAGAQPSQRQLGFVVKAKLTSRLTCDTGVLFGLSEDAPDADLRLFLSYGL